MFKIGILVFLLLLLYLRLSRKLKNQSEPSRTQPDARSPVAVPATTGDDAGRGETDSSEPERDAPADDEVIASGVSALKAGAFQDLLGRGPLLFPPIVQLGRYGNRLDCIDIIFLAVPERSGFQIEAWCKRGALVVSELRRSEIRLPSTPPHARYQATIGGLQAGESFSYRVKLGSEIVFEGHSSARKGASEKTRVALAGDMGNGSLESSRIAYQIWKSRPDLFGTTGDVVYMHGRASEYFRRYLPIYNAAQVDAYVGVPLLCQVPSFGCPGNHCVGRMEHFDVPSFDAHGDLFAYFLYWSLPMNGPLGDAKSPVNIPNFTGNQALADEFLKAAGERFPRTANYSFDFGNMHWLVLDGNGYMDWTNEALLKWVDDDLAASSARWKLVMFHQPPFTSNAKHKHEKRMRLLCAVFQKHGVDMVFSGHAHYYERSYPLVFSVQPGPDGKLIDSEGRVKGDFAIDKTFDGEGNTRANGIVYIVTGAGGAKLDVTGLHWQKDAWKPFTHKVIGDRHSFTLLDVDEHSLTLQQIDYAGKEIDRFTISK